MVLRPCLDCRKLSPNSRCVDCARAKDRARGTTTQRGLGWQHQQQRRVQLDAVAYCEDCGHTGSEGNPLTGEHGTPRVLGGRQVTATLCRVCNSRRGGRLARR